MLIDSQIPNTQIGPGGTCVNANAATLSSDGQHFRRVRAVDAAGNYSAWSDEWMITKDATNPSSSVSAFGSASTSASTFDVSYTSSDGGAGVKQVQLFYRFEGGSWTPYGIFTSSPIAFTVPNTTVSGTYEFYTIAEDQADDLTTADMADGSLGDNGVGNIESKAPVAEASIEYVAPASGALPGDVVINEIMWMGTSSSPADEWIELRNMTSSSIDLTGWEIVGAGSGSDSIILTGSISANGSYLLTNYEATSSALGDTVIVDWDTLSVALHDAGEVLTLRDAADTVIDQTPAGAWAAGVNGGTKHSMERNSVPGDGTLAGSWHSCLSAGCNNSPFWDIHNGSDNGTPRATNLSENDPTFSLAHPLAPEVIPAQPESEPSVSFDLREDKLAVSFAATDIESYDTLQYELSYDTDTGVQGAIGTIDIEGQESISCENILLGTCSTAGVVCTYHTGISTITLTVRLTVGSDEIVITKEIIYE